MIKWNRWDRILDEGSHEHVLNVLEVFWNAEHRFGQANKHYQRINRGKSSSSQQSTGLVSPIKEAKLYQLSWA